MRDPGDDVRNAFICDILKPRYFFAVPEEQSFGKFTEIVETVLIGERKRFCDVLNKVLIARGMVLNENDHARALEQVRQKP